MFGAAQRYFFPLKKVIVAVLEECGLGKEGWNGRHFRALFEIIQFVNAKKVYA